MMNVRRLVFALVLLIQGGLPVGWPSTGIAEHLFPGPAAAATGLAPACSTERVEIQACLERLWRKQARNGEIAFEGADTVLCRHPLMATLALEAFRSTGDNAFLQKSYDALKGYFNYLLLYHDADRDFLIERASAPDPAWPADVEDVAFNAMLALDMLSLSRICVELKMPLDALYWYRGMKTISERLVQASYDPAALFFLSTRATSSQRQNLRPSLSVLPVYFTSELGPDTSLRLIRAHMLTADASWPDSPSLYLSPRALADDRVLDPSVRALRTLLLLGALEWNGLADEASRRAAGLVSSSSDETIGSKNGERLDEIGRYADCLLRSSGPFAPFPRLQELVVLDQMVFQKALLDPEKTAALRKSIATIEGYLAGSGGGDPGRYGAVESPGLEQVASSIREVYFSISLLREKWKERALFSQSDLSEIPGFDLRGAATHLWDDVIETLREAETRATRDSCRADGFDVTATLENPSLAPGEAAQVVLSVSSATSDVAIRSIVVYHSQVTDTLWSGRSPLAIVAGAPARELRYSHPVSGHPSPIVPIACSVDVRFADGRRARYHFRMSASITLPVTCAVTFPKGTTLGNGTVPIDILIDKRVPRGASIQVHWHSPVGLKPVEGPSLEAWMPEETPEGTMTLSVPVPTPCRPGSFPFVLTVFANGEEIGHVSSALFRHYQWLFVGPFPGRRDALDTRYPPESRTDPLDTYTAALGELSWRTLPPEAYGDAGKISLGTLLPQGSVGFLYTVIETAASRTSAAIFACDVPAVLFVNGEVAAESAGDGSLSLQRARVSLRAGPNNVLVKTVSTGNPVVFFQLGDEEDLLSDEFNNNLWELVDGYEELANRGSTRGAAQEPIQRQVTITYRDLRASSVAVVGNFNGWSPANSAMRKNKYGEWEINLYLSPGRYTYRLLVDNTNEVLDPKSPYTEPDGYGGQNSVLYVQ